MSGTSLNLEDVGKTILMTPNVLEICFQQTATFQKYTKIFQQNHYSAVSLICSFFNYLTVSQVPSRFLKLFFQNCFSSSLKVSEKFVQTVSHVSSRSLRSLTVSQVPHGLSRTFKDTQGPSNLPKKSSVSLKVPHGLSTSLKVSQGPSKCQKKSSQCLSGSFKVFQGPLKMSQGHHG